MNSFQSQSGERDEDAVVCVAEKVFEILYAKALSSSRSQKCMNCYGIIVQ